MRYLIDEGSLSCFVACNSAPLCHVSACTGAVRENSLHLVATGFEMATVEHTKSKAAWKHTSWPLDKSGTRLIVSKRLVCFSEYA